MRASTLRRKKMRRIISTEIRRKLKRFQQFVAILKGRCTGFYTPYRNVGSSSFRRRLELVGDYVNEVMPDLRLPSQLQSITAH